MSQRIIETEADLAAASEELARLEPRFALILSRGALPLRRRADGFAALASAIVSQQVSTASAAAIWARLEAAGLTSETAIETASDDMLRACGVSRPKLRYLRALAAARLDWLALRSLPTETVVAELTALPGIGRWTAEIYAKFALGHADAFAAGDLALQEAARRLFDLDARPSESALRARAEAWRPVRAVAARALWVYYRQEIGREGVT